MGFKRDDENGVLTVNLPKDLIRQVSLAATLYAIGERPRKSSVVEAALEDYFAKSATESTPKARRPQLSA